MRTIREIGNIYLDPHGYHSAAGRIYAIDGLAPTIRTPTGGGTTPLIQEGFIVRKLTPRECFRLQGWSDEKFDKAALVNSDTQLYKQSGNGVTVSVVKEIAERLR